MELKGKAKLLRIFSGDSDRVDGKPLYESIVETARKSGLAGATVYRGIESFGASHSLHTLKIFALSGDLPIIIDIVDSEENIEKFIPKVNEMMDKSKKGGLIITEDINVVRYKSGERYLS